MSDSLQISWILPELLSEISFSKGRGESLVGTQSTLRTGQLIIKNKDFFISDKFHMIKILFKGFEIENKMENGVLISIDSYSFKEEENIYHIYTEEVNVVFSGISSVYGSPKEANEEAGKLLYADVLLSDIYPKTIQISDCIIPKKKRKKIEFYRKKNKKKKKKPL